MNPDALAIEKVVPLPELDRLCARAELALEEWLLISHTSENLRGDTEAVQGEIANKHDEHSWLHARNSVHDRIAQIITSDLRTGYTVRCTITLPISGAFTYSLDKLQFNQTAH